VTDKGVGSSETEPEHLNVGRNDQMQQVSVRWRTNDVTQTAPLRPRNPLPLRSAALRRSQQMTAQFKIGEKSPAGAARQVRR
jgi:hypothetical protein